MQELWDSFGHVITNILPKSPFVDIITESQEFPALGWLNWLLPIGDIIRVFGAWLGALALFYLVQIVLRWVKVIQG